MHVDSSKCLQNGLLKRQAPAFQKKDCEPSNEDVWKVCRFSISLLTPNIIFCPVSLGTKTNMVWLSLSFDAYESPKYSRSFPSCSIRLHWFSVSPLVTPGALDGFVLSPLSLCLQGVSLMYQGIFLLPWNVFLLFYNTLFVDQWPFSVALLQFGVYLSLILAIKSFAFETDLDFVWIYFEWHLFLHYRWNSEPWHVSHTRPV